MAAALRGLAEVRPEHLRTLCYKTTSGDLAGKAVPPDSTVRNMSFVREWRREAAAADRGRRGSPQSSSSSQPPVPSAKRLGFTSLYAADFDVKSTGGFASDRELARSFRPGHGSRPVNRKSEGTSYTSSFPGYTRSRLAAAKPETCEAADNALGGLIAVGSETVTSSHSKRLHAAPPRDMVVSAEPMPAKGCPHWLGAGSSSGDFQASQYGLEFRPTGKFHTNQPLARSQLRGSSSTPNMVAGLRDDKDPEQMLRESTMRSHYKSQFGAAPGAHERFPAHGPNATAIRQTIIGR